MKKLAKQNGIEGETLEELVHDKKLNNIVLKELQSAGRQGGLNGIEIIDGVVMADEEWNAANVCLQSDIQGNVYKLTSHNIGSHDSSSEDQPEGYLEQVQQRSRSSLQQLKARLTYGFLRFYGIDSDIIAGVFVVM